MNKLESELREHKCFISILLKSEISNLRFLSRSASFDLFHTFGGTTESVLDKRIRSTLKLVFTRSLEAPGRDFARSSFLKGGF